MPSLRTLRLTLTLLLALPASAFAANTVSIGGSALALPEPEGFISVTPKMPELWQLLQMTEGDNRILGLYIPASEQQAAETGQAPTQNRNVNIQIVRKFEAKTQTAADFGELKAFMKNLNASNQADATTAQAIEKAKGNLEKASGLDPKIKQARSLLLPVHLDTATGLAFSHITTEQVPQPDGKVRQEETISTVYALFLKGKIFLCYVTGGANDLHWTRTTAADWAQAIAKANTP